MRHRLSGWLGNDRKVDTEASPQPVWPEENLIVLILSAAIYFKCMIVINFIRHSIVFSNLVDDITAVKAFQLPLSKKYS